MKHRNSRGKKRNPLLRKFLLSLFVLLAMAGSKAKAQEVQIHHLGLGDGDCTLICIIDSVTNIFTGNHLDTAVILIDAQRNSSKAATQIVDYIDTVIGKYRKKIDFVVLSHLHIDHYGNMFSVLTSLKAKGYDISTVFDRTTYTTPALAWNTDSLDNCYSSIAVPGKYSASANKYLQYVNKKFFRFPINPGKDMLIAKGFMNTRFVCVAANGAAIDTTTGKLVPFIPEKIIQKGNKKIRTGQYEPRSENDLSLVFVLNFQGFVYFTGGDIGGSGTGGNYTDGETPISAYLRKLGGPNFHFCSFKVSHHGSAESTDAAFLTANNPTLAVIPASLRSYGSSTKPLPTCNTITNLRADPNRKIYATFVPIRKYGDWRDYCAYKNLNNTGDVRLRVLGLPGYDTIKIYVATQNRNKTDYKLTGAVNLDSVNCTKVHPVVNLTAARKTQPLIHWALNKETLPEGKSLPLPLNNPPDAEKPKAAAMPPVLRPAPPAER